MERKNRLQQKKNQLQEQWSVINEKIHKMEKDKIIETRTEEIFRLETKIHHLETDRQRIENKLQEIDIERGQKENDNSKINLDQTSSIAANSVKNIWKLSIDVLCKYHNYLRNIIIFLLCGIGYWYLDSYIFDYEVYYNTVIRRNGETRGFYQLNDEKIKNKNKYYRFTYNGRHAKQLGLVYKIEIVNKNNSYTEKKIELEYDSNMNIVRKKIYYKEYVIIYAVEKRSSSDKYIIYYRKEYDSRYDDSSSPELIQLTCSAGKNEETIRYLNRYHERQPIRETYGMIQKFDENGLVIERSYLDKNDSLAEKSIVYKFQYDKNGNIESIKLYDASGKPASIDFTHEIKIFYDTLLNETEIVTFDRKGNFFKKYHSQHERFSKIVEEQNKYHFNIIDGPVGENGYDEDYIFSCMEDNVLDNFHLWFGFLCNFNISYKIYEKYTFNERGHQIERAYINEYGDFAKPNDEDRELGGFICKNKRKYRDSGEWIEEEFFDEHDKPIENKYGVSKKVRQYNEKDNLAKEIHFNKLGMPISKYNELGELTEWSFFDAQGKPALASEGYHKMILIYNMHDMHIDTIYLDTEEKEIKMKAVVISVNRDSQAKNLGILPGDVFLQYSGRAIEHSIIFTNIRKSEKDNFVRKLVVLRNGNYIDFMIKQGELGVQLNDVAQTVSPQLQKENN